MDVQNYGGVIDALVAAIANAGDHPNEVQRIVLTPAEMQELQDSKAFCTTVSKYYGQSDTLIIDNIVTDLDGKYLSLYLGGILVVRHPVDPDFVAALTYPAGSVMATAETNFNMERYGKKWMLIGAGHQADDFTISENINIELGLAIRKAHDQVNYGSGGTYEIELQENENWTFAVTVGSNHTSVKNVCDMYNVTLELDTDPSGDKDPLKLTLMYDEMRKGYQWLSKVGTPLIKLTTGRAAGDVSQSVSSYSLDYIRQHLVGTEFNDAGSPLGMFVLTLTAVPKWKAGATVVTEVMADIKRAV